MRIQSSNLSLSASSASQQTKTVNEQLNAWVDENDGSLAGDDLQSAVEDFISNNIGKALKGTLTETQTFEISDEDNVKIQLLTRMIEAMTGKKIRFFVPDRFFKNMAESNASYGMLARNAAAQPRAGWGINYQRTETITENASMSFSAKGTVRTADGKEISLDLNLHVSRSFSSSQSISLKAGDALIDPLVVNFSSASADLTTQKFSFDIDSDGKAESLSFVKEGSGFLVYDKNGNGKADNGGELFGPKLGNGFLELRAFDGDKNGWIDENDPVYDTLRIWTKDAQGNDRLVAIGQAGIGAIYLGSVSSAFSLKDEMNAQQGAIARTGVFLRENGTAGTVQHVDLQV